MSHFLCGEISLREGVSPGQLEAIAFDLVGCAHQNRLHIFVGSGMQGIVFDILGRPRIDSPIVPQLPFLICDSPLECTSEEVVYPSSLGKTRDQWCASVSDNLARVERLLSKAFEHNTVRSVMLTFSEGYSPVYEEISCGLPQFIPACAQKYTEKSHQIPWEAPLMRVSIHRA